MRPARSDAITQHCQQSENPSGTDRRTFFISSAGMLAALGTYSNPGVLAADRAAGSSKSLNATRLVRVRTVVELNGHVRFKPAESSKDRSERTATIQAKSNLDFEEEFRTGQAPVALQHYHLGEVDNTIAKQSSRKKLRDQSKTVYRNLSGDQIITQSVSQPLTRDELDLIEGPMASMFVDQLFPTASQRGSMKAGTSWEAPQELWQRLLYLDSIQSSTMQIRCKEVDKSKATLEIEGNLEASVRSVATSMAIKGTAQWDEASQMITWLAVAIDESREVGEAEPGFKITARVRMLRAALDKPSSGLTLAKVEPHLALNQSASMLQLESTKGAYQCILDRDWHTLSDNGSLATIRLIKKNSVIAQCNITNLPDMDPGYQLTLEGFQQDIQQSLSEVLGGLDDANEKVTASGLRLLRVTSHGMVEDVPIRWINLHLSDDSGRHTSLVFTMNATNADQWAGADEQIAGSFRFLPRQSKSTEPAAKVGESPTASRVK
jgi:hypothetical protein